MRCPICGAEGGFTLRSARWDVGAGRMIPFVNGPFPCPPCAKLEAKKNDALRLVEVMMP